MTTKLTPLEVVKKVFNKDYGFRVAVDINGNRWINEEDIAPKFIAQDALLKEAVKVIEFYSTEESVLRGADYQMYATSSRRQSLDDGGAKAREFLARFEKETK